MGTTNPTSTAAELQEAVNQIASMPARTRWDFLLGKVIDLAPKLLAAILILIIGVFIVRWLLSFTRKVLGRSKLDPTLHRFILSITGAAFYIVLGVIVLTVLVPSAAGSLIALFGVFGLAVSLAVKDSLSNLAGGMSVLFTKPFALGDYVKIGGNEGSIEEIRLNYTVMKTLDNKVIHIPNGDVSKAQIINFTCEATRRLDLVFSISYDDDFERAEAIIREAVEQNPLSLQDPAPLVRMTAHGASSILLACRVWVATPDYWTLNFDLLEEVKRRFDAEAIHMPYNQMDVHINA